MLDTVPGHTEPMPFPGPYAHDPAPVFPAPFGPANDLAVPAPSTTAGVTEASSSATTMVVRGNVPSAHHNQPLPSDVKETNFDGLPPLILAARRGNLDQLRKLLEQPGVDLDQVDARFGSTALMFASEAGNLDVVEFLLASGADVNFKNQKTGETALMFASAPGKLDVVKVLLKRPDIQVNWTDNYWMNALAHAAHQGHADVVGRLIDAGADMTVLDVRGLSCLHLAIAKGHANVVECLLARGAPLPDPLPVLLEGARNMISLSDLFLDRKMPAASPDNPLHLTDPHLLDDHHVFFQALVATLNPDADGNVNKALADWFAAQDIRHAVGAPIMHSLGDLSKVWCLLAAPGQAWACVSISMRMH